MSSMMSQLLEVRKALKAQMKVIDRMMDAAESKHENEAMAEPVAVTEAVAVAVAMAEPKAVAMAEPTKPKSKPMTAHTAFTKHLMATDYKTSPEYIEFLEKRMASAAAGEILYEKRHQKVVSGKRAVGDKMSPEEAKVGAHIPFVGHYRSLHPEEYQAFEAKWNAEPVAVAEPKPVPSAISELIENYGSEAAAKPKRVMSDAHKAAMKAGREKAAAAKKAVAMAEPKPVAMAEPKPVAMAGPQPTDLLW